MRFLRYLPVPIFAALLMIAADRATSVAGAWLQATALISTISSWTGIPLAVIAAWDAGRRDLRYQQAAAVSPLRSSVVIAGPAVLCAIVSFLGIGIVSVSSVLSVNAGGSPWLLSLVSSLMWLIFCAVAGTTVGYLTHRPVLGVVSAMLLTLACAVLSMLARDIPWIPRFIFLPGNGVEMIARQPVNSVILIQLTSVFCLSVLGIIALSGFVRRIRGVLVTGLAVLIGATSAVSVGATTPKIGSIPRNTVAADAVCTDEVNGASFCSWPEDAYLVDQLNEQWDEYITVMSSAGLPVPAGVYGQPGSGHRNSLERIASSPAEVYTYVFDVVEEHAGSAEIIAQENLCKNSYDAWTELRDWATYAFRKPDDPFWTLDSSGTARESRYWVENEVSEQTPEQQARTLAPLVRSALGKC